MAYINGNKIAFSSNVNIGGGIEPTGEIEITENGTHDVTNYATAIVNVESSSGATSGDYYVKVIDYDGTILKEANLNAGDTFELPTPPSHDGLVFQEWSCSQDIVDNVITIEDNNVMVGAVYTTASGLSEFDIELTKKTGLDITFNMDGTKDWGDGTSDDLKTHTYTNYGEYTIKCNGTTMSTSSDANLFGSVSNANSFCVNARLANIAIVGTSAFDGCYSLRTVTMSNSVTTVNERAFSSCQSIIGVVIPNAVTRIDNYLLIASWSLISIVIPKNITFFGQNAFTNCHSLINVVIPKNIPGMNNNTFQGCSSLKTIIIPGNVQYTGNYSFQDCHSLTNATILNGVKTINQYLFKNCYALKNITIPDSVINIQTYSMNYCYGLKSVSIPKGVETISAYTFQWCFGVKTYDFSTHTAVPTLSNINAFSGISAIAKIIVPDALYDEWIVATNWATYADYIYKASEV